MSNSPSTKDAITDARTLELEGHPGAAAWALSEAVDRAPDHDALRVELVRIQCARIASGTAPPAGEIEEALAVALLLEASGVELPPDTTTKLAEAAQGA